ncbi:MAG: regulatory protein RecX [Oceanobacter sp.]
MASQKSEITAAAVSLLASREHCQYELEAKLKTKWMKGNSEDGSAEDVEECIHQVVTELKEKGWQSDERFAFSFIRSKAAKGKGPIFIRHELKRNQIASEIILDAFQKQEIDWFELALEVARKKLGSQTLDKKGQERIARFLTYRGFDSEQLGYALDTLKSEV